MLFNISDVKAQTNRQVITLSVSCQQSFKEAFTQATNRSLPLALPTAMPFTMLSAVLTRLVPCLSFTSWYVVASTHPMTDASHYITTPNVSLGSLFRVRLVYSTFSFQDSRTPDVSLDSLFHICLMYLQLLVFQYIPRTFRHSDKTHWFSKQYRAFGESTVHATTLHDSFNSQGSSLR